MRSNFRVICFEAANSIKRAVLVVDPLAGFCKCDAANPGRALKAFTLRFDIHDSGAHSDYLAVKSPNADPYRRKALAIRIPLRGSPREFHREAIPVLTFVSRG